MNWRGELKKKVIKLIPVGYIKYPDVVPFIESLLKEQIENVADRLVEKDWISKDGFIYDDLIRNSPPPTGRLVLTTILEEK